MQLCRSVMSLCNFLTHTTNGRTDQKGVDCHRKLRVRDNITLDLPGKVLQRSYKGDLPLPTSKPRKKKKKQQGRLSRNLTTPAPAITSLATLPQGHPAKGPGTAGLTVCQTHTAPRFSACSGHPDGRKGTHPAEPGCSPASDSDCRGPDPRIQPGLASRPRHDGPTGPRSQPRLPPPAAL